MANYNVGNIEVGVISQSSGALNELQKVKQKLKEIKTAQTQQSNNAKTSSQKTIEAYSKITSALSNVKKSFTSIIDVGKIYVALNYLRRFANGIAQITTYASDYAETLNKFQVSFGNLYKENLKFVNELSKAYGLSKNTLMDYTSTFNNMLKALGSLSDKTSSTISRTLTQMAIDYSSLFNQSIDSTMKAFQSVLSGSVRPIRSTSGFDVSETTIYSLYQSLGGDKSMRQLNQLEKRLLRIYAVQQQMIATGSIGDYARTIENVGNQIKVFKEQIIELGSTWGRLILYYIKPLIQGLNGIMIAFNTVGEALTKNIIEESEEAKKDFASLENIFESTNESAEELSKSLTQLGLDQLNIIGGTSSGLGEIDPRILDAISEYKSNLSGFKMEAHNIAQNILKWAGFTFDANGQLINVEETVDRIKEKIVMVGSILLGIGGTIIGVNLSKSIMNIVSAVEGVISLIGGALLGKIMLIVGAVSLIGIAIIDIIKNNKEQADKWLASLKLTWEQSLKPALDNLLTVFSQIWEILKLAYEHIIKPIALIIGDLFVNTIVPLLGVVTNIVSMVLKIIMPFITLLASILMPIIDMALAGVRGILYFIELIIQFALKAVEAIVNIVSVILEPVTDVINWIIEQINKLGANVPEWLGGGWEIKKIEKINFDDLTAKFTKDTTSAESMEQNDANNVAMTNAILESNNRIVNAINNKNTTLSVNGKELAETINDDLIDVSVRRNLI